MSARANCLAALAAAALLLAASPAARAQAWDDPLAPTLRRMDRYLQLNQQEGGVTMDWRYSVSASEEIRQTVVCQLLAYVELYRLDPRARLRVEIVRHADFLIGRLADIRSYTPFDGMLAYALLAAWETTGEERFLTVGSAVTNDMLAIPTWQCRLNGGLMVAMATAEFAHLTGSAAAEQKTHDILAQLVPEQNADGSFPHWCQESRDIHYTGWMAFELLHLRRLIDDAHTPVFLASMNAFLEGRIGPDGRAIYQQPVPGSPGDTLYYFSRMTGCDYDYDSRGWTVEPAYCALLFDEMGSQQYRPVMTFLASLETGGTFKDLYAYWPPPSDPEYPWCIADTSVVNMSIIFWALSTQAADRIARGVPVDLQLDDLIDLAGTPPPPPPVFTSRPLSAEPNPSRGSCTLRFALAAGADGSLELFDAGGRRVRVLAEGAFTRGPHALTWDGRDAEGRSLPRGLYFARLRAGGIEQALRIALAR